MTDLTVPQDSAARSKTLSKTYDSYEIQFRKDGWFNATAAAAKFGKEPAQWLRLPEAATYIQALERKYGKITYYASRRGRSGGTWMHPKLAVAFARWLDTDFALWCDEQIETIIHGDPILADWFHSRHQTASTNKVMAGMLTDCRADIGKDTKFYHYANEAKLVNWALTGKFSAVDREALTVEELDLLAKLETSNTRMLARDIPRDLRKERLQAIAEQAPEAHGLQPENRRAV